MYRALHVRFSRYLPMYIQFFIGGFFCSLVATKGEKLQMSDVEGGLDGNICRCTGYRPILDAFKSFASDAPEELKKRCVDIEDCLQTPCPLISTDEKRAQCCKSSVGQPPTCQILTLPLEEGRNWIKVMSLQSLYQQLNISARNGLAYQLVAGNTGIGELR
jgi:xanthine dehydrogenase/oxidase